MNAEKSENNLKLFADNLFVDTGLSKCVTRIFDCIEDELYNEFSPDQIDVEGYPGYGGIVSTRFQIIKNGELNYSLVPFISIYEFKLLISLSDNNSIVCSVDRSDKGHHWTIDMVLNSNQSDKICDDIFMKLSVNVTISGSANKISLHVDSPISHDELISLYNQHKPKS
jgi:hypothetical protein